MRDELRTLDESGLFAVPFGRLAGIPSIVNDHSFSRPSAERLDADAAGACVEIQEHRVPYFIAQDVEQRLLHLVGRGSDARPCGHFQLPAFSYAPCDSHDDFLMLQKNPF